MSTINANNIISISNERLKTGTPMLCVAGQYIPAVPLNLLSIAEGAIPAEFIDISEDSIKSGTPCVMLNGVVAPLLPLQEYHSNGSEKRIVAFRIPEVGKFRQEGRIFFNPADASDSFEYTIWEHSHWIVHPFESYKNESSEYMYMIYTEVYSHPEYPFDGKDITFVYRCSKSKFNTVGAVWTCISSQSFDGLDTLTVTECTYE